MKLSLIALTITGFAASHMGGAKAMLLRGGAGRRGLAAPSDDEYDFMISQIRVNEDWCLTAADGTKDFKNLRIRTCDLQGKPANQLWRLDDEGRLHSKMDDSKCVILGFGHDDSVHDHVRVRIADCGNDKNQFEWDGEYFKPVEDASLCLTNRGPNPHNSDIMHALTCMDRGDFKWRHVSQEDDIKAAPPNNSTIPDISLCEDVQCPPGNTCDPADGSCKTNNDLRPCIAVIDEADNDSDAYFEAQWAQFRADYPNRPFCLLKPEDPTYNRLYLPPDFTSDSKTTFSIVNRDNGAESSLSDWFTLCGVSAYAALGIDYVGLFVDKSGSMNLGTVQASYDKFLADLSAAGLTHRSLLNREEDWIEPFMTVLN